MAGGQKALNLLFARKRWDSDVSNEVMAWGLDTRGQGVTTKGGYWLVGAVPKSEIA